MHYVFDLNLPRLKMSQFLFSFAQKCTDREVSNKTKYYTTARTLPPSTNLVKALLSVLVRFRWRQFVLVSESSRTADQVVEAIKVSLAIEQLLCCVFLHGIVPV